MYKFEAIDKKNYQEMFERYNSLQTQTKPTPHGKYESNF